MEPYTPPAETSSITEAEVKTETPVWGFWATFGWSLLLLLIFAASQVITLIIVMIVMKASGNSISIQKLQFDGDALAICTFGSMFACIPATALLVKLKKGSNLKEYLGLRLPRLKTIIKYVLITIFFMIISEVLSYILKQPTPETMVTLFKTADYMFLLVAAIVIAAPVCEELIFRGFMITGMKSIKYGGFISVFLSSALFASIHGAQYNLFGVSIVFAMGCLMGIIYLKTKSLYLVIGLHGLNNLIATVQFLFIVNYSTVVSF